jgi:release factor glutamine methyltransferase
VSGLKATLAQLAAQLDAAEIDTPVLDARLLVGLALGLDRQIYPHEDINLTADTLNQLNTLVDRRLSGEPISRMRGWREFWSMRFDISPACLDPRPDSETLVAAALEQRQVFHSSPLIIDYGTGSGCLLLAVLSEWPEATGIGLDLNPDAIVMAISNAGRHELETRTQMLVSNWCDAIDAGIKADIILANPPYIPTPDMQKLDKDVRDFDPDLALDGGDDGLYAWRALLPRIEQRLSSGGIALVEIGKGQEKAISALAGVSALVVTHQWHDLSGTLRVLGLIKTKEL